VDEDIFQYLLDNNVKLNKAIEIASIPGIRYASPSAVRLLIILPTDPTGTKIMTTFLGNMPHPYTFYKESGEPYESKTLAEIGAPVTGGSSIADLGEWLMTSTGSAFAESVNQDWTDTMQYNNQLIIDAYNQKVQEMNQDFAEIEKMVADGIITAAQGEQLTYELQQEYEDQGINPFVEAGTTTQIYDANELVDPWAWKQSDVWMVTKSGVDMSDFAEKEWEKYEGASPFMFEQEGVLPFKTSIMESINQQYPSSVYTENERPLASDLAMQPTEAEQFEGWVSGLISDENKRQSVLDEWTRAGYTPAQNPGYTEKDFGNIVDSHGRRMEALFANQKPVSKYAGLSEADQFRMARPIGNTYNREEDFKTMFEDVKTAWLQAGKPGELGEFTEKYPFLRKHKEKPAYARGERPASYQPMTRKLY